jgi:hypothetical protein
MKSAALKKLKFVPLYLLYLSTFGMAAVGKWRELPNGAPEWFQKQFEGTVLNLFPGALTANYYLIAALESLVTLAFVVSLVLSLFTNFFTSLFGREFMPDQERSLLQLSLWGAQFVFVVLGFGLRLAGDFHGAAELFVYFGVTLLASSIVSREAQKSEGSTVNQ